VSKNRGLVPPVLSCLFAALISVGAYIAGNVGQKALGK